MLLDQENIDSKYPFYPFKLKKTNGGGSLEIINHLTAQPLRVNRHAAEVLRLLNGEYNLNQITKEIYIRYTDSTGEGDMRHKIIPLMLDLTQKNLLWWRDKKLEMMPVGPPENIFWEITAACNLRCSHCVVSAGNKSPKELNAKRCFALAKEMADFGVQSIAFSGGEPLIRPDFKKIAEYVKELGLSIQVATNGTLINEDIAQWLKDLQANVQVSLDGSNPKIHELMRPGSNAFEKTIAGIKALIKSGHEVTVGTVLTSVNKDDIFKIVDLSQAIGVTHFRLIPFVPKGRGEQFGHLELPPKIVGEITKQLIKLREKMSINIVPMEFEEMICGKRCSEKLNLNSPLGCSGAISYATITPSGELLPCHFFEGVRADSVMQKPFHEVWIKSRFLNYFRSLNIGDIEGACLKCQWLPKCGGSCRAANFAKGDLFGPNLSCWLVEELEGI